MAEERDNMIFGMFGGIYHVCSEKRDICITDGCYNQWVFPVLVIVTYYLKNRQEMNKFVNIGVWIKIQSTKCNFIIYNINQTDCVSFANESFQVFD